MISRVRLLVFFHTTSLPGPSLYLGSHSEPKPAPLRPEGASKCEANCGYCWGGKPQTFLREFQGSDCEAERW
ncbi:hypothetical protein FN846DRAFT_928834 [Sphaerosporella brunnea]|uniref:Uncharacterized protein n=1 Tax=Sphaerosporella brunnea TaxID=1250544 RepID=A0A5J5F9A8_9PEZI|nr:hypothetical protein FN846DRAFT_928834 [Sphaerosporella brunnea]